MKFFTWIFASCILCTSVDQRNIFLQLVRKILKPLLLIQFIPRHRSSDIPAVDSLDNFHYTQHSPFTKLHLHYAVQNIHVFSIKQHDRCLRQEICKRQRQPYYLYPPCSRYILWTPLLFLLETLGLATLPHSHYKFPSKWNKNDPIIIHYLETIKSALSAGGRADSLSRLPC